jgi:hypothetical protein
MELVKVIGDKILLKGEDDIIWVQKNI